MAGLAPARIRLKDEARGSLHSRAEILPPGLAPGLRPHLGLDGYRPSVLLYTTGGKIGARDPAAAGHLQTGSTPKAFEAAVGLQEKGNGPHGRIRTHTDLLLRQVPLLVGLHGEENWHMFCSSACRAVTQPRGPR